MRYVVAMIFAVIGVFLTAVLLSPQVADWVTARQAFESPDDADSLHMTVYMASNVVGLFIGWLIGWTVAGATSANQKSG